MTWNEALQRVEPGQVPASAPLSLRTWTSQTFYGLCGGMLFGGYRGLQQARNPSIPSPTPAASAQHRMAAFFVRESILTGARVGVFVSIFSAAALTAEGVLGSSRPASYAAAGALTCGLFGGATAGWVAVPAAAAFGAFTSGAAGAAHVALEDATKREIDCVEKPELAHSTEESPVTAVIHEIEENLQNHPLRTAESNTSDRDTVEPSI